MLLSNPAVHVIMDHIPVIISKFTFSVSPQWHYKTIKCVHTAWFPLHVSAASPPCVPGWIEVRLLPGGFTPVFCPAPALAWPALLQPTDASLSGPSPQGACGFSSAADTNRIRDDILPGWRGLSWSNWDGGRRHTGLEEGKCVCLCVFSQEGENRCRWRYLVEMFTVSSLGFPNTVFDLKVI